MAEILGGQIIYLDDAFGGSAGAYATETINGGVLSLELGGIDDSDVTDISGGFQQTFDLQEEREVTLSFQYTLTQAATYEADEYSEVLYKVDGGEAIALARITGDGNNGGTQSTGAVTFTVNLGVLGQGPHTITVGGFNNKKTIANESTSLVIEDFVVSGSISLPTQSIAVRVRAGKDDAEESASGSMSLGSSDLELVEANNNASSAQTVGIRFTQVDIPQGATITNAYVQFTTDETDSKATELTIFGEKVDTAAQFANSNNNISSRDKTGQFVTWDPETWDKVGRAGAAEQTPDLTAIVQEIVNQADWSPNNALAIIVTGSGQRTAESYNGSQSKAPLLFVEYVSNQAPTVQNVLVEGVVEDGTAVIGTFAGDDNDPSTLAYTITSPPAGGLVTNNNDGTFTFDPGADFQNLPAGGTTQVTFTYTATDAYGEVGNTGTVTVDVTGVNDAPVVRGSLVHTTNEDANPLTIDLLADSSDADDGDELSVTNFVRVDGGTRDLTGALVLDAVNGTLTIDPSVFNDLREGTSEVLMFEFDVTDEDETAPETLRLTIEGRNDRPEIADQAFNVDENSANGMLVNPLPGEVVASDPDLGPGGPDTLTYDITGGDPDSVFLINSTTGAITVANGLLLDHETTPSFSLTVAVTDNSGQPNDTATATVTVTVDDANDAPVANDDDFGTTESDKLLMVSAVDGVLSNDADEDVGDIVGGNVLVTAVASGATTGTVGQQFTLLSGALLTLNADGSGTYDPNGAFGTLPFNQSNTDTFTYTIEDSAGAPASATATVTINGANTAPTAMDDSGTTSEDARLDVLVEANGVLNNDDDPDEVDGDVLTVIAVMSGAVTGTVGQEFTLPSGALLTLNANGTYSYDPTNAATLQALAEGVDGNDAFTYTMADSRGEESSATVNITVNGKNDAPVANDDMDAIGELAFTTDENTSFTTGSVLANDSDPEDDPLSVTEVNGITATVGTQITLTSGAFLTPNANGTFNYDPNGLFESLQVGESDTDTFTYTASDGQASDMATVTIKITGVNDGPTANNDVDGAGESAFTTNENDGFTTGSVLANDTDPEDDVLIITAVDGDTNVGQAITLASDALVQLNPDGRTFNYDPNGQFEDLQVGESRDDTFTYTISDGDLTDMATVTIKVTGVNDIPDAVDDQDGATGPFVFTTDEDSPFKTGSVLVNDTDPEDDPLSVIGFDAASTKGGLVTSNGDGTFNYDPNGQFEFLQVGESDTDTFTYTVWDGPFIANGSFENTSGPDLAPVNGSSSNFIGVPVDWMWTPGANTPAAPPTEVQLLDSSIGVSPSGIDGSFYLELHRTPDTGTLSQTVTSLIVGEEYEVSFLWGNRGEPTFGDDYNFTVEMGDSAFSRDGSDKLDFSVGSITFTAAATSDDLNITFNDLLATGGTETGGALDNFVIRQVSNTQAAMATVTITIEGVNDLPIIGPEGQLREYTEGDPALSIVPAFSVLDPEANFDQGTLIVTVTDGLTDDALSILETNFIDFDGSVLRFFPNGDHSLDPNVPDATGIVVREISSSVVFNSFELVITFNDQADAAAVGAAGSAVAYNSTSDNPTDTADTASRTVTFELTDAAGTGDPLTQTITIIPVNDAPVNAVPPALQMVDEDTALVFNATNNNLISVSDVDAGTEDVQVTLAVTSGALTLSSIANLAFLDGDGATDASMTFTGSLVDINAALAAGLTYQGNGDFNGLDALTITTNDLGNTGAVAGDADAEQDEDTVLIQVAAVNDSLEHGKDC